MCISLIKVILLGCVCVHGSIRKQYTHATLLYLPVDKGTCVHTCTYIHVPNFPCPIFREIRILSKLKHKNVIRLVEVFEDEEKQKMYVVLEYCVGGLQELLERCTLHRFPLQQAHRWGRGGGKSACASCQHSMYMHTYTYVRMYVHMHASIHTCTQ